MGVRSLSDPRDRWRSAGIVCAVHLALAYALVSGLGVKVVPRLAEPLALIDLPDESPAPEPVVAMLPEEAVRATEKPKDPEGAAAPPALKNSPTPVVAPLPEVRLPVPRPLPAAPVAGQGSAPAAGAAPVPGPGTGRGGVGTGLGSGLSGSGTGGGGGGGVARGPDYLSGRIHNRDVPQHLLGSRSRVLVGFEMLIGRNGRVRDCRITRSSGNGRVDAATCAAVVRRLRYSPARDTAGRPVEAWTRGENEFFLQDAPPDQWYDAEEVRD